MSGVFGAGPLSICSVGGYGVVCRDGLWLLWLPLVGGFAGACRGGIHFALLAAGSGLAPTFLDKL